MPSESTDLGKHQSVTMFIRGYGGRSAAKKLALVGKSSTVRLITHYRPNWANLFHAREEFRLQNHNFKTFSHLVRLVARLISIGSSRQDHLAGLRSGFVVKVAISVDLMEAAPQIKEAHFPVVISRSAAKSGILTKSLSAELERTVRKFSSESTVFITHIKFTPTFSPTPGYAARRLRLAREIKAISKGKINKKFLNIKRFYPNYSFYYKSIKFVDDSMQDFDEMLELSVSEINSEVNNPKMNRFFQCENMIISQDGICLTVEECPIPTFLNVVPTNYWPSVIWKKPFAQGFIIPNSLDTLYVAETSSYHYVNSNWAHFIEDDLPIIYGLHSINPDYCLYLSGNLDTRMSSLLALLFPDLKYEIIPPLYKVRFNKVILVRHVDSRNSQIMGYPNELDMTDQTALIGIRNAIENSIHFKMDLPKRIYVFRGQKGLRVLINEVEVRRLLQLYSFEVVATEDLDSQERIHLFHNAQIVVGETGAGLANLYFATAEAKVLELRHPGFRDSKEHIWVSKTVGFNYDIIQGHRASFLNRLRFGSDAFKVNLPELEAKLIFLTSRFAD